MSPNGHPPPPPPPRRSPHRRQIQPNPATPHQSVSPKPSPTQPHPQIQPLASSTRTTAWASFFFDSPPPPPRHGCLVTDEVDWVAAMPDSKTATPDLKSATPVRPSSYADAVRAGKSCGGAREVNGKPATAFTPANRSTALHPSSQKQSAIAVTP
ncbi:unnamed protein product [Urochloa humidicola]